MESTLILALGGGDWAVVAVYALLLLGSGVWLARTPENGESYFLAGRRMPAWAVAVSTLATSLSAATFVAAPDIAYGGDLTYLIATLGSIVAAAVVGLVFLPALYRSGALTVYQLLGERFGDASRKTGGAMFLLGRICASGARVYIAAHALAFVMNGSLTDGGLVLAVWIMVGVGILYTVFGGIATVIWTDVIQAVVFLVAVVIAVVTLALNLGVDAGGAMEILRGAEGGSKLRLANVSTDPGAVFTLWTALIGFTLLNIGAYGTDQDLAQRLLTCKSKAHAARSLVGAVLGGIPVTALFLLFGLLLYVQDVASRGGPVEAGVESMMRFITGETGALPAGVGGALIAGLFASGLSSLDSALNAMASSIVNDFKTDRMRAWSDRRLLGFSRLCVVAVGVLLGLFATGCVFVRDEGSDSLIEFALRVMTFAYAGLVGVFGCALLTRRGNGASSVAGMLAGLSSVIVMALFTEGLAFPWQLTIGVVVSFSVCLIGRGTRTGASGGS